MNSFSYRNDPMFLRNQYETHGKFQFPYIRKQEFDFKHVTLIALSATICHDTPENCSKIVHGFLDDYRMNVYYKYPDRHRKKLSQYRALITPDYSDWREMNTWREIESISHSRWVGKHWQETWNMPVIPSITWSSPASFEFCFSGIERGSWVAISTVGNRRSTRDYMIGYDAMMEQIEPSGIICLGEPFPQMRGNIVYVPYKYPKQTASTQFVFPFMNQYRYNG